MILSALSTNLAAVVGLMIAVWLLSLILRDVSIVDIFWGLGFVVIVWNTLFRADEWTYWAVLLATMTTIWGIRLGGYLLWRNWGKPEDYRYQSLRKRFGSSFPLLSLAIVFLLQAALIWVVSLPLQTSLISCRPVSSAKVRLLPCRGWRSWVSSCGRSDCCLSRSATFNWLVSKPIRPMKGKCSIAVCGNTPGTRITLATLSSGGDCQSTHSRSGHLFGR